MEYERYERIDSRYTDIAKLHGRHHFFKQEIISS